MVTSTAVAPAGSTAAAPRRTGWTVALPLLAAAAMGILAGIAPMPVVIAVGAVAAVAAVVFRLEWIAFAIVAVSVLSENAFAPTTKPMRRRIKSSTAAIPVAIIAAARQGCSGSYSTE